MAILRNDTTVRSADGQTTSSIITAANIGNYGISTTSTYYIGTTQNVFNRASGAQTLTGVSIDGNAATVTNGVYTTGAQTIAGTKTFSDGVVVNGATYYTFNKPTTTNYQTVALFGSASAGLFLTTDSAIIGTGAYYNAGWIATATSGRHIDFAGGTFNFNVFSGATVGGAANWGSVATLNSSGTFSATGDFRAPIFYDSNNTAYYIDPASTTALYDLTLIGTKHTYLYINPGNGYEAMVRYNGGSGSGWYVGKRVTSQLVGTESFHFYSIAASATVGGIDTSGNTFSTGSFRAPIFYDSDNTTYYLDPNASTSGNLFGVLKQNDGKFVRDSYFRTISGVGDYYASGASGWYTVASITLTTNCTGGVLYGTLYDNRYDGADTYQIAIVARAECDFTTNNESHYVNVGCTILGSTGITNYQSKIRVLLVASSANSRTYEVQFFETSWNRDTWQLETGGSPVWTIYSTAQAPGTSTGTARVFYVSNKNADNIRANTASYSPIYYDSNNTSYYIDPASTSIVNSFKVYDALYFGDYTTYLSQATPYLRITTANGYGNFGPANSSWFHMTTDRPNFYMAVGLHINGDLFIYNTQSQLTSTSVRAPIFYDSGDTTYYLDPANTGTALAIAGNAGVGTASPTLSSGKGIHINSSSGHANLKLQSSGRTWELLSTTGAYFSVYDTTGGADRLTVTSGGNVGVATTAADTNLQVVGHVHVGNQTTFENTGGWNKTIYLDGLVHARMRILGSAYASGKNSATETYIWVDNSVAPYSGLITNAGSFTINAGFTTLTNSARSPIFYDSDNTAYYVDPASTSVLNALTVGGNNVLTTSSTLTAGNLSGTIPSAVLGNSTVYVGTTAIALNRGSASQTLTGVSIDGTANNITAYTINQNVGTGNAPSFTGMTSTAMFSAYTSMSSNDDWQNSPISIRERGLVGIAQSANTYSPNLNFHWGSRVSNSLWMDSNGNLAWGSYDASGVPSSDGAFYTANLYASIYYDKNDTTYYVDPNSLSNIRHTIFHVGSNLVGATGVGVLFDGNYTTGQYRHRFRKYDDGNGLPLYIDYAHATANSFTAIARFGGGGSYNPFSVYGTADASGDFRAPIFYDSNDTTYYIDPANGGFNLRGGNSNRVTFNSGDSGIIVTNAEGVSSNVRLGCAWGRPGIYNGSSITVGAETQIDFVIANVVKAYIDSSSNLFANSSVRAPIFYDSNDTNYYVDAASTSVLNRLKIDGGNFAFDYFQSLSDFTSGTLVTTDIPATAAEGESFVMNVVGKSYSASASPFNFTVQGYLYNSTIINFSGIKLDSTGLTSVKIFENGGVLCFWWPTISYWNAFEVSVRAYNSAKNNYNRVTNITNSTEPVGTKKVTVTLQSFLRADVSATNSVDLRAPIFYDSNDTSYYLDPASTSVINILQFAANTAQIIGNTTSSYGSLDIRGVRGGWRGIHFNAGGNTPHLMFDGSANGGIYYETGGRWASYYSYAANCWGFGTSTTNSSYNIYAPTGVYSGGRVDGTIFYDSNDTGYYCDPASTSRLNTLSVGTGAILINGAATATDRNLKVKGASSTNIGIVLYDSSDNFRCQLYGETSNYGFLDGLWAGWDLRKTIGGNLTLNNNTTYYLNPASTTNLNNLTVAGTMTFGTLAYTTESRRSKNSSNVDIETVTGLVSPSGPTFLEIRGFCPPTMYRTTGDRPAPYGIGFGNGGESAGMMPIGAGDNLQEVRFYGANSGPTTFTFTRQLWEGTAVDPSGSNYYSSSVFSINTGTGAVTASTDIRSPIYYDQNDTAYYVDPASTSRVSTLYVANVLADSASVNGRILLYGNLHIDAFGGYDIYCNYYSGKRFRTYKGVSTGAETFRADTDGIIYAFEQFRTPILYDYNNTAYYCDPASTSNFNVVNTAALQFNSSTNWNSASVNSTGNKTIGYNLWQGGKKLNADEDFNNGNNGITLYNNSGGSALSLTRTALSTAPNSSGYVLRISYSTATSNGTTPGFGGFYFGTGTRANAVFVTRFIANIPSGRSIAFQSNAYGTNATSYWLTNNVGTGKWEEYAYLVICGDSGTFNSTNYFNISGGADANFTWDIASATVFDITNKFEQVSRVYTADQQMVAPVFYDKDNTSYYLDAGNTGNSLLVAGSVGIGTTSPGTKLDIASTQADGITLRYDTTTSYRAWIRPYWNSGTDTRLDFAINRTGGVTPDVIMSVGYGSNVGIGTTSPASKLTVQGDINVNYDSTATNFVRRSFVTPHAAGNRGATLWFGITDGSDSGMQVVNTASSNASYNSQYVAFHTHEGGVSAAERMRITSVGNLGVNITSPSYKVEVYSGSKVSAFTGLAISNFNNYDGTAASLVTSQLRFAILENPIATYNSSSRTFAILESGNEANNSSSDGFFAISTRLSGAVAEKVRVNSAGNVGIGTSSPSQKLHIVGTGFASADFRAPIFYDSDNTGYYSDPNGTSLLNVTRHNSIVAGSLSAMTSAGAFAIYSASSPYISFHDGGIARTAYMQETGGRFYFGEVTYTESEGSFRAPLFYDVNDTAYYTDPASLSNILELKTNKNWYDSSASVWGGGINMGGNNPSIGWQSTASTIWYMLHHSSDSINFYRRNTSGSWNQDCIWDSAGNFIWRNSSVRAPIFYDFNDTNYYLDPASTSILNTIRLAGKLTNNGFVSDDDGFGVYWDSGESSAYAIYREAGSWTNPFPDLRIAFHTGIKLGANSGYNGIRFYNDYDMATQVMSVNNTSDALGANNVYVNNSLQAGSSLRAPIFYDSNDTAYYLDPNSTSNLLLVKTRNTFGERVAVTATASTTINTQYNVTELTLAATITTLTLSNIQSSGTVHMWTIVTVGGGVGYSITWPAAVKWPGGTAPTLTTTSSKRDIYQFITYDGGTNIYAIIVGQNL